MENGIYSNGFLKEEDYHEINRLSASHIKNIVTSSATFFEQSWLNKRRNNAPTEAMKFGSAMHKAIIEGEDAFNEAYEPKKNKDDYENLLVTVADMKEFLDGKGMEYKKTETKGNLIEQCLEHDDANVWDVLKSQDENKIQIDRSGQNKILTAAKCLKETQYAETFTTGLPEVAILFEIGGIKLKAKLDYIKPGKVVDLKTFSASFMDARKASFKAIADYKYGIQAVVYLHAMKKARELVNEGKVFGFTAKEKELLAEIVNSNIESLDFLFVRTTLCPVFVGIEFTEDTNYYTLCKDHFKYALKYFLKNIDRMENSEVIFEEHAKEYLHDTDLPQYIFY